MNDKEFNKVYSLFDKGLANLDLALSGNAVDNLVRYALELLKWNKKVNLVAKNTSVEDIVEKHFLDSLTLLPVLKSQSGHQSSLLDVGSGAGFPGLVIKIVDSQRQVYLLEPRQRRVSFLNHVIRTLHLKGIEVYPKRSDELARSTSPQHYGVITGRAVADVTAFLDMVKGLAGHDTLVMCMQGASGPEQWKKAKTNQAFAGLKIEQGSLPFSKANRFILVFKKK